VHKVKSGVQTGNGLASKMDPDFPFSFFLFYLKNEPTGAKRRNGVSKVDVLGQLKEARFSSKDRE